MPRPSIYKVLEITWVYTLVQKFMLMGANRFIGGIFAETFHEIDGKILDVGCGPRFKTPVSAETIVGLDINLGYLKEFINFGNSMTSRAEWYGVAGSANALPFCDGAFDECRCVALLHHLPNESAISCLREMLRITRSGGRVVIFDAVWPVHPILRPIPWLIWKFDRGEWVRTEEELRKIVDQISPKSWTARRFTYTWTGLEGIFFAIDT